MRVLGPAGNRLSPMTRERLSPQVMPNTTLRKRILSYHDEAIQIAQQAAAAAVAQHLRVATSILHPRSPPVVELPKKRDATGPSTIKDATNEGPPRRRQRRA